MHINNFDTVKKLVDQLKVVDHAIKQVVAAMQMDSVRDRDGYWCALTEHRDGSGWQVDMTGCCVANEMLEATLAILNQKKDRIVAELQELGVKY